MKQASGFPVIEPRRSQPVPDSFPLAFESFLATIAELLRGKQSHEALGLLARADASVELSDFDHWNGGTYTWSLRLEIELGLLASLGSRATPISTAIGAAATKVFDAYDNHSLAQVHVVAAPVANPHWRAEAERLGGAHIGGAPLPAEPRHEKRVPLRYPPDWKFARAEKQEPLAPAAVEELQEYSIRMSQGAPAPQDVLETFKAELARAAGRPTARSSSYDWAVTDLDAAMREGACNAATFIVGYWYAVEMLQSRGVQGPTLQAVNEVLSVHQSPFRISPPELTRASPPATPVRASIDADTMASRPIDGEQALRLQLAAAQYQLGDRIGSGASGVVYRAHDQALGRTVAVKTAHPPTGPGDDRRLGRFRHEVKLLSLVQHPGIPYVLAAGEASGVPYLVMQYIEGESLLERFKQTPRLGSQAACRITLRVLRALAHAHARNIVHRDVKPENILLSSDDEAYLIDFSIGVSLKHVPGLTRLTGDGLVPGTVDYLAPEVRDDARWDHRVDVYSTGVVLYESLVGRRCTPATLPQDLVSVPAPLAQVLAKACALDPEERFENAGAFADALVPLVFAAPAAGAPGVAVCRNVTCPGARWTPRYQPPLFKDATLPYCPECGQQLVYPCTRCGQRYEGSRCCPGCELEVYREPLCLRCNAPLGVDEAQRDTAASGCSACLRPFLARA